VDPDDDVAGAVAVSGAKHPLSDAAAVADAARNVRV
jgi:hypothetical protein